MPNRSVPTPLPTELKISEPAEGVFACYSNFFNVAWTAHDLRLQFCELTDASEKSPSPFTPRLEREAVITVSWMQVKQIARVLSDVVAAYEAKNGPLPIPSEIKVP